MAKTVYEFIPKLGQLRDDVLFGDVWERTEDLSKRDRSLITITLLGACPSSHCSRWFESDSFLVHEQAFSALEDR